MPQPSQKTDAFYQAVEWALERVGDPEGLGKESPLAAPYFLGQWLTPPYGQDTAVARGNALRRALETATEALSADHRQLADLSFFKRDPKVMNIGIAMQLNMSLATYYRHRQGAVEALAQSLNRLLSPALRSDVPRAVSLVGRERVLEECALALSTGQSVALVGPGGVGKSALGARMARDWPAGHVCWFTVRPPLNDQLNSLVFSVAFILRDLGASFTWRQVVADRGVVNAARALALLRHDLRELPGAPVLLCVDEVDLLEQDARDHVQMAQLLGELRGSLPMLLMGHQVLIETDRQFTLGSLAAVEAAGLLACLGVPPLPNDDLERLHRATRGNPALLKLCALLLHEGDALPAVLDQLALAPSTEVLLSRVWRRLSAGERALLMALAVFDGPAPRDAWADQATLLEALTERDLVLPNDRGGADLAPHTRAFFRQRTPPDLRPALHWEAARIYEARGDYTAAAVHYVAARQPGLAIWLWLNHRIGEVERGQAAVAYRLFHDIAEGDLDDDEDRRALAVLRAEQELAAGNYDAVGEGLAATILPPGHPFTSYARQLAGDALARQGQVEQALDAYRSAMEAITGSPERREVWLRARLTYNYATRLADPARATHEAALALWQALTYAGYAQEMAGNLRRARGYYAQALEVVEELDTPLTYRTRTLSQLGHLLWKLDEVGEAITCLQRAIDYRKDWGEPVNLAWDQLNLAGAYIMAGRHAEAHALAQEGLRVTEAVNHPLLSGMLHANAAEACLNLGLLEAAEQHALRALETEELPARPYAFTTLGLLRCGQGRSAEAESFVQAALQSAREAQDPYGEMQAWRVLAEVLRPVGDQQRVRDALDQAGLLMKQLGLGAVDSGPSEK